MFLVDKSAFLQQRSRPEAAALLEALASEGQVATCDVIALELLYSARGPADYAKRAAHLGALHHLPADREVGALARQLQGELAQIGHHRRPIPDLLIAATAIIHGATVLHYDRDFELIASRSPLSHRWIVSPPTPIAPPHLSPNQATPPEPAP